METGSKPTADAEATAGHLVFISAKSDDYEHAAQVYQFLIERGARVFFSRESLPQLGNADYGDQIDEALEEAAHMVVVTSSKKHVMSSWVKREWRLFDNELRSGRKTGNLLTVTTGGMQIDDLPITLRGFEVVGLT
ncbi:MAG: toll/interleukin-1 receptor domain-containing protein, partial [Armatimonadota bacterium]